MQPEERDAGFLLDMLEHARGVINVVAGKTLEDYLLDETLRLVVERRLEIIGEAARHVSSAFRETHPEVPWSGIIAQRNLLIHEYGEIQDDIVWNVATVSVPDLAALLEPLVPPPPALEE
ncbi:MAG TPA: HepT-like ribonuclease domain-containing protein [Armatimonadota bacterium]|nr:HepT-like ribonuclease domain-containing protein [Armatimonadota bacterium]